MSSLVGLGHGSDERDREISDLFARSARQRAELQARLVEHGVVTAELERLRAEERARLLARVAGVARG